MPNTQTSDADITYAYDDGGGEVGEDMVEDLADALVSFQPREWGGHGWRSRRCVGELSTTRVGGTDATQ